MDIGVVLEWEYAPSESLEQCVALRTPDFDLEIDSGKAVAMLDPTTYEGNPHLKDVIAGEVQSRLRAAQMHTHQPFQLAGPTVTYVQDDGKERCLLDVACSTHIVVSDRVDIQVLDADGKVVRDTKLERITDKAALGTLIAKHQSDVTLQAMLNSLDTALRDQDDELVHLYEIREALASRFSSERNARQTVGVGAKDWSRMGRLCNEEPLRQGRHRGRKVASVRDATDAELGEARSIATTMVRGYIAYLERDSA